MARQLGWTITARNTITLLNEVPSITGLHEKALLEATLFGLPMVSQMVLDNFDDLGGRTGNDRYPVGVAG